MKKIFSLIIIIALFTTFTTTTSAISKAGLQAQLNILLQTVGDLQSQMMNLNKKNTNKTIDISKTKTQPYNATSKMMRPQKRNVSCTKILNDLYYGMNDRHVHGDITKLQKFLSSSGVLKNQYVTGFFGPITIRAVKDYQKINNIVSYGSPSTTGFGRVGPATRKVINKRCNITVFPMPPISPQHDIYLHAKSSDSADGMIMIFTASHGDGNNYPPSHTDGRDTRIDFGDGSEHEWVNCFTGNKNMFSYGKCRTPKKIKHIYKKPGTYTAKLLKEGGYCQAPGCPTRELARVIVKVPENNTICTTQYDPVCGQPIKCPTCPDGAQCALKCQRQEPKTYGNKCELKRAGAELLYEGKCKTNNDEYYITTTKKHIYTGDTLVFKVSHGDGESHPPSYTDGRDTRIDFGDGSEHEWVHCSTYRKNKCFIPAKIKHTYKKPGTFTAKLVMEGGYCIAPGCPTNTLATVRITVKNKLTVCDGEYSPVCARPQGCSPCPEGAYCTMLCQVPEPKTYSNKCEAEKANATYVHDGKCDVVDSKNTPPTIDGFSGPTKLELKQKGIWKVSAHDKEGNRLTYDINWGDEPQIMYAASMDAKRYVPTLRQDTTFEHTYNSPGKYTITIRIRDEQGLSTKSTMTVKVITPIHTGGGTITKNCKSWYDGCNTCSRNYIGGPAMCTMRACIINQVTPAYCKIYFHDDISITCKDGKGGQYNEGDFTNCIKDSDSMTQCIADARFVCRGGKWIIGGRLPIPQSIDNNSYQINNSDFDDILNSLKGNNPNYTKILDNASTILNQYLTKLK